MEAAIGSRRSTTCDSDAHNEPCNVGETERWISMFAAGALVAGGLSRGSLAMVALGGALAYRGYTGHCHVYQALEYSTAQAVGKRPRLIVHE